MSKTDVIRAWKDPEYRAGLSAAELSAVPANPAGPMELGDEELDAAAGGDAAREYESSWVPSCTTCCRCPNGDTWYNSCCSW